MSTIRDFTGWYLVDTLQQPPELKHGPFATWREVNREHTEDRSDLVTVFVQFSDTRSHRLV